MDFLLISIDKNLEKFYKNPIIFYHQIYMMDFLSLFIYYKKINILIICLYRKIVVYLLKRSFAYE
jgi:hypothetical protein